MRIALIAAAMLVTVGRGALAADEPPPKAPPGTRVRLRDDFPLPELAGIGVVTGGNLLLKVYETDLAKARGEPLIGHPLGFDRALSNAAYQGPFATPFLAGAPRLVLTDYGPGVYLGFRGLDTLFIWFRGRPLLGSPNADHKFFAFAEAYTVTTFASLTAKVSVGRVRPFEELHRYGSDPGQPKTTMSFWSNQTAASFCFATFLWRDVGDWLTSGALAGSGDGARLWLGRVLPGALLYGLAGVDGYSRIVDQRHWFSDVVVGATVGTTISFATYAYHFDWDGQPRRRWSESSKVSLVPTGRGASLVGTF